MGSSLDKPIVEKHLDDDDGNGLEICVSAMQGWRVSMEDSHTIMAHIPDQPDCSYSAVYDGHGGDRIAMLAGRTMPDHLMEAAAWADYRALEDKTTDEAAVLVGEAMKQAFLAFDKKHYAAYNKARASGTERVDSSGCTAIACITTPTFIVVANVGDSRGILSRGQRTEAMSYDHKPQNPVETARIERSGGHVSMGRVNGDLAVARALGDYDYKDNDGLELVQQAVSPEADIEWRRRNGTEEFVLLACDGVWDVMRNNEVGAFVRQNFKNYEEPMLSPCNAMSDLIETCLNKGSRDNMTALVVTFVKEGNCLISSEPKEWKTVLKPEYAEDSTPPYDPDSNKTIRIDDF